VRRRPQLFFLSFILVACRQAPAVPVTVGTAGEPPALDANATVVAAVDGDTVLMRISGDEVLVRLLGIDTPETKHPDKPVECYGPEASARTAALLPEGTPVRLERDLEARDRYDRLLAYVFRASDGLFVNRALAGEGYARTLWIAPNRAYAPELDAAMANARSSGLGLWAACPRA
jgi:micrococcal nuclease